jgi:carboxylesterase type B
MLCKLFLIVSATTLALQAASSHDAPTVHAQQGTLTGTYLTSRYGRKFAAFQGIPYAQPPIGDLRFKEPVPPKPWQGVWNATQPGAMCLQCRRLPPRMYNTTDPIIGDEDCLFLNIYTPKLPTDGSNPNLDVLLNIHSGAFMYGWGHEFGPEILMDRDIIWITINYRLGAFGFLDTEDEVVPGNMGLKDQSMALRWVKENIAAFGGNPESITLTGTSAGGCSVHFHYLSPWSRGLFKGGIAQSGTVTLHWALMEEGRSKANQLGALLGCSTGNTKTMVECLRHRPAQQIVKQCWNYQKWMYNPFSPFAPTIEQAGPNPFLSKHPLDLLLEGNVEDVPLITSVTTEDGLVPAGDWVANEETLKVLEREFDDLIPHILDYNYTVPKEIRKEVTDHIRQHYFRGQPVSKSIKQIIQMITDRVYLVDGARATKLQAAVTKSPVYFYLFGYRGKHSFTEVNSGTTNNYGASHLDDTAYTIEYAFKTDETEEDKEMSNLLLDVWSSFAATGKPALPGRRLTWEPTTPNSKELKYLYIGSPKNLEMRSSDNLGDPNFWDSLPINERQVKVDTPISVIHSEL